MNNTCIFSFSNAKEIVQGFALTVSDNSFDSANNTVLKKALYGDV